MPLTPWKQYFIRNRRNRMRFMSVELPKYFRRGKGSNLHRTIERTAQRTAIGKTVVGCRNEEDREAGIPRRNSVAPVLRYVASPLLRFSDSPLPAAAETRTVFFFPRTRSRWRRHDRTSIAMRSCASTAAAAATAAVSRKRDGRGKKRGERQGKGSKRRV